MIQNSYSNSRQFSAHNSWESSVSYFCSTHNLSKSCTSYLWVFPTDINIIREYFYRVILKLMVIYAEKVVLIPQIWISFFLTFQVFLSFFSQKELFKPLLHVLVRFVVEYAKKRSWFHVINSLSLAGPSKLQFGFLRSRVRGPYNAMLAYS